MQHISFNNPNLRHMGRVSDAVDPVTHAPFQTWAFPYTQVSFRCTGTYIGVRLVNHWGYGRATLGAVVDGMQLRIPVPIDTEHDAVTLENGYPSRVEPTEPAEPADMQHSQSDVRKPVYVTIAEQLPNIMHEVTIFKRQDEGNNRYNMISIELDDNAQLLPPSATKPSRRMEFYGDSVTCGERCEALCYEGQADPDEDLSGYSNSWYSYASITSRNLNAQAHLVAQGGASLIDGIGWFHAPHYLGMESIWDRSTYNPEFSEPQPWDFTRYTPHVVVVALGQNDAHPRDFMALDYDSAEAQHWRARYVDFVHALREKYPKALIVLTTTIVRHDAAWDRAIGEVCDKLRTEGEFHVKHFLYSRNGCGTDGHPRVPEDEQMAAELTAYLESFGPDLWQ